MTSTDKRNETLAQFSDQVDAHFGRKIGFADAVVALHDARARIRQVEDRRKAIYDELKSRHERGSSFGAMVVPMGGGVQMAVVAQTNRTTVVRAVSSIAAKQADPAAWEAARVLMRKVAVTAPKGHQVGGDSPKLPPLPRPDQGDDAVIRLYQHPAFDVLKELRDIEADTVAVLDKLAANVGWDGEPIAFSDGWKAGLKRREYSGEAFKRNNPELFEALATVTERSGGTRLRIMDLDRAIEHGLVDEELLDTGEIDGD